MPEGVLFSLLFFTHAELVLVFRLVLGVYVYLLHLENGYDLLAQVNGDQVVK